MKFRGFLRYGTKNHRLQAAVGGDLGQEASSLSTSELNISFSVAPPKQLSRELTSVMHES